MTDTEFQYVKDCAFCGRSRMICTVRDEDYACVKCAEAYDQDERTAAAFKLFLVGFAAVAVTLWLAFAHAPIK